MIGHGGFGGSFGGGTLAVWTGFRAPLVAFAVALATRLARHPRIAPAAGGLGVVAGWAMLFGAAVTGPLLPPERLLLISLAALAALAGGLALPRRAAPAAVLLLGLFAGWWLAGGPHLRADLARAWPLILGMAAYVALLAALTGTDAWRLGGAALALWGGLRTADAAVLFPRLALVPLAATAALLGTFAVRRAMAAGRGPAARTGKAGSRKGKAAGPPKGGKGRTAPWTPAPAAALLFEPVLLPCVAALACVAAVAALSSGRVSHGGFGAIDAAALAPLPALLLAPRLRRFGRLFAALLAAAASIAIVWVIVHALPHR